MAKASQRVLDHLDRCIAGAKAQQQKLMDDGNRHAQGVSDDLKTHARIRAAVAYKRAERDELHASIGRMERLQYALKSGRALSETEERSLAALEKSARFAALPAVERSAAIDAENAATQREIRATEEQVKQLKAQVVGQVVPGSGQAGGEQQSALVVNALQRSAAAYEAADGDEEDDSPLVADAMRRAKAAAPKRMR